jgi:dipeptidyl aminopeptidase/acylaminoacyl peptidase
MNATSNRFTGAALLAVMIVTCSRAAEPEEKRFRMLDVFKLQHASDPQISPDGLRVVYVRNAMDIMTDRQRSSLWIVAGTEHRPLTSGDNNEIMPRWSPDGGRSIAFVQIKEGRPQLMCVWMDNGRVGKLADLPFAPGNLTWSPDSKQLAFSMHVPQTPKPFLQMPPMPKGARWADPPKIINKVNYRFDGKGYLPEGYHHLFVIAADGGTPRQVTSGSFHHADAPVWSRDGKSLIFSANRHPDWEHDPLNTEIYEVGIADGTIKALTKRKGPDSEPALSPDGSEIAYVGFDDKRQGHSGTRLYVMRRDGSNPYVVLKDFDRDVKNPVWAKNGKSIYFKFDEDGNTKIGNVDLLGTLRRVADNVGGTTLDRPYSSGSFSVSNDAVAYTYTRPDRPAEVAVVGVSGSKSRTLTSLNAGLLDHKTMAKVEEIWFPSSHDNRKIHGWIVTPPGFDPKKKYPLILEIHGGPFANYGPRFAADMQLYAAAGYVVLYVNPRGSTSYGQEFGNLIHHNYPGNDYDDLMSGVDAVIKQGYIDDKNLFVTGGSGGGVLSAWIIGKTHRFRAAVVAKPVINWFSFVLTADIYPFFAQYWFPGYPWEQPEHYHKRSPISLVGNVTTPTLIITGEEDHRTPMSESEQLYQALKLRKVEAMLVRVPGAPHNIAARPSQLIAKAACVLQWFEDHKKK